MNMKTNMEELKNNAHELVKIAKKRGLIKSHKEAFKEFPVEEENHKGKKEYYAIK